MPHRSPEGLDVRTERESPGPPQFDRLPLTLVSHTIHADLRLLTIRGPNHLEVHLLRMGRTEDRTGVARGSRSGPVESPLFRPGDARLSAQRAPALGRLALVRSASRGPSAPTPSQAPPLRSKPAARFAPVSAPAHDQAGDPINARGLSQGPIMTKMLHKRPMPRVRIRVSADRTRGAVLGPALRVSPGTTLRAVDHSDPGGRDSDLVSAKRAASRARGEGNGGFLLGRHLDCFPPAPARGLSPRPALGTRLRSGL